MTDQKEKQYQTAIEVFIFICWGCPNEDPIVYIKEENLAYKFPWKTEAEWVEFFESKLT